MGNKNTQNIFLALNVMVVVYDGSCKPPVKGLTLQESSGCVLNAMYYGSTALSNNTIF